MSLTLEVGCSNHQSRRAAYDLEIPLDGLRDLDLQSLKAKIERNGWVVQINGDYIDTYCTKECAK